MSEEVGPSPAPAQRSDQRAAAAPPGSPGPNDSAKWYQRPTTIGTLVGAVVAAAIIGLIIGAVSSSSNTDSLQSENDDLRGQVSELQDRFGSAIADRTDLHQQLIKAERQRDAAEKEAKNAQSEAEADLADQQAELDQKAADLADAKQTLQANTIPDGIWQVGVDFEAGLYRAPGGSACYWATLNSAKTSDIADNGLGKNPTVQIDTPFFETDGCGQWTKIG